MATTIEQIVTFGLNRGGVSFEELTDYAAKHNLNWFRFISSSTGCLKTIDAINQMGWEPWEELDPDYIFDGLGAIAEQTGQRAASNTLLDIDRQRLMLADKYGVEYRRA